jgi:hypothetical protein
VLALSGCGLESFIQLSPPVAVINAGDGIFEFDSTSLNNEEEFRGYEVHYKLFLSSENPVNYYNTFEDLVAASYRRLNNPLKDSPANIANPLIYVDGPPPLASPSDRGESFTVTIDFSNAVVNSDYPQIKITGATINEPETTREVIAARRAVQNNGFSEFKRFTVTNFESADINASGSDVTAAILAYISALPNSLPVGVVCFAVSWGVVTDTNLPVYSQPVWLGFEQITFPYP